ncbi:hypothetical protein C8R42DRAFT_648658 [Lentinula raphanica]|nr:hypothetical protein C8R42DRAFT_648658 [Lentinula raphanica]
MSAKWMKLKSNFLSMLISILFRNHHYACHNGVSPAQYNSPARSATVVTVARQYRLCLPSFSSSKTFPLSPAVAILLSPHHTHLLAQYESSFIHRNEQAFKETRRGTEGVGCQEIDELNGQNIILLSSNTELVSPIDVLKESRMELERNRGKPLLSKDSPKQPIILPLPTRMKKLKQETHIANDSVSSPPEAVHNDADFRSSLIKDFDEPASTRAHTEDSPPPRDEVDSNSNVHLTNKAGLLAGQAGSSVVHGLTLNGSVEGAPKANGKDALDSSKSELQAIFQSADTESPLEVILKERLDLRTDGKEMFVDVCVDLSYPRGASNGGKDKDENKMYYQFLKKAKGTASLTLELSRPLSTQTTAPPTDTEILALDEFIDNNITEVLNSFERVGMSNAKGLENVQGGVIDRVTGSKLKQQTWVVVWTNRVGTLHLQQTQDLPRSQTSSRDGLVDGRADEVLPIMVFYPEGKLEITLSSEERRRVNGLAIGGAGEFEWVVEGDGLDDRCIIQSSLLALKRASGSPITFSIRSMGSNADMIVIMTGLVPQKILNSRDHLDYLLETSDTIHISLVFLPILLTVYTTSATTGQRPDKDQTIQGSHIPPTHILPLPVLPIPLHPLLPHQLHLPSSSPPDVTAFTSPTLILPVATKIKSKTKKMSKKTLWRKKIMDSIETATQSTSAIETKTTELSRLLRPHCVHHVDHVAPEHPASVQAENVASGSSGGEADDEDTDAGSSRLSGKTTSMATSSLWSTPVTPTTVVSTSAACTSTSIDAVPDLPILHDTPSSVLRRIIDGRCVRPNTAKLRKYFTSKVYGDPLPPRTNRRRWTAQACSTLLDRALVSPGPLEGLACCPPLTNSVQQRYSPFAGKIPNYSSPYTTTPRGNVALDREPGPSHASSKSVVPNLHKSYKPCPRNPQDPNDRAFDPDSFPLSPWNL